MGEKYRCHCSYRSCGESTDRRDGERGKLLNAKEFRRHQQDEAERQRRALEQRARNAQQSALQVQNDSIEAIFRRMDIAPLRDPADELATPKYKVDVKRKMIADISGWQEEVARLRAQLDVLDTLSGSPISPRTVQQNLSICNDIHACYGEIGLNLRVASSGNLAKEPSIKALLEEVKGDYDQVLQNIYRVEAKWRAVERGQETPWGMEKLDSSKHFQSVLGKAPVVIQLVSLMVVACHVILGLPRRGCLWLFSMCSYIIETTFVQAGATGATANFFSSIIHNFPKDIRAVTDNFSLDGSSTVYAVCPKCHQVYPPSDDKNMPTYRERCNSKRYGNRCGELMTRPKSFDGNHRINLPIKPYVVFDMPNWLAGIMSREGYEKLMDGAWERMKKPGDKMDDIFQGSVIREFMGPDGRTHFSDSGPDGETGRYLFSMGFDFFNPLRTMANGKRISIGVIALICLNLPIHIRYKPENIFLAGVIPGPKEPSLDAINPYIQPFVAMFLRFWKGIKFSQTSLYEYGRWIICALVAVICDLPAARKIGGFSACSHEYFCSVCFCTKTQHTYGNWDYRSWRRRTNESCREWAESYRTAESLKEANSFFDRSGLRYSELLQLPYFDPTKHIVVDPMHNLFLGLIKEHFQSLLGYLPDGVKAKAKKTASNNDSKIILHPTTSNPLPQNPRERTSVRKLVSYMEARLEFVETDTPKYDALVKRWSTVHMSALVHIAKGLGCISDSIQPDGRNMALPFSPKMRKGDVADVLVKWKFKQSQAHATPAVGLSGRMFHKDEIQELWNDIKNMVKPSWATSVPDDINSAGAKLKSDQWRSIGELFLPVTLIRIWSSNPSDDREDVEEASPSQSELLHLTMLLCSAINVVTSRVVSSRNADLYMDYMTQYRKELERMFPGYICHPNHHMAMHIGEFLRMFGPVHGWWTFPVERMIGSLQRIPTNYKPGEYEVTIGRSWTRSSNFRALFSRETCPPALKFCSDMFSKLTMLQDRNSLGRGVFEVQQEGGNEQGEANFEIESEHGAGTPVPQYVRQAFTKARPRENLPPSARIRGRISIQGITYATSTVHEGNSGIFRHGSDIPWSINNILELVDDSDLEQYWFAARRHKRAEVNLDPYAKYPHIRARMWSDELEDAVEFFPSSDVETHYAKCRMRWEDKPVMVAVSLSKIQWI